MSVDRHTSGGSKGGNRGLASGVSESLFFSFFFFWGGGGVEGKGGSRPSLGEGGGSKRTASQ